MSRELVRVVAARNLMADFPASAFEGRIALTVARTDEELRSAVRDAEVLYSWQVPGIIPAETPHLRWVQLPSAGADHVRGTPLWTSDVLLTASQGMHTVPMSEHVFAMILALTRQLPTMIRAQDRKEWVHDWRALHLRFGELRGKTMGIVGWGKIGDGVAHLARAFGMRVIGTRWSINVPREHQAASVTAYADPPWLDPPEEEPDIVYPSAQLYEVLAESDLIVLILPLTDETRDSFGPAEFKAMKRGAYFFNIGRGAVVNEDALVASLRSGHVAGAGLDVFAQEPLQRESALWSLPNVIISPHVGGVGEHTRERGARLFAVNLARYLEGQELLNLVDRRHGY